MKNYMDKLGKILLDLVGHLVLPHTLSHIGKSGLNIDLTTSKPSGPSSVDDAHCSQRDCIPYRLYVFDSSIVIGL